MNTSTMIRILVALSVIGNTGCSKLNRAKQSPVAQALGVVAPARLVAAGLAARPAPLSGEGRSTFLPVAPGRVAPMQLANDPSPTDEPFRDEVVSAAAHPATRARPGASATPGAADLELDAEVALVTRGTIRLDEVPRPTIDEVGTPETDGLLGASAVDIARQLDSDEQYSTAAAIVSERRQTAGPAPADGVGEGAIDFGNLQAQ